MWTGRQVHAEGCHQHRSPPQITIHQRGKEGEELATSPQILHPLWETGCPCGERAFSTPVPLLSGEHPLQTRSRHSPLTSSHPSCQGNAHLWDGKAGKWARKVSIQKLLAKPPMKRRRCNVPPGSGKASVLWSREIKHLVPVQGRCLGNAGEERTSTTVLWARRIPLGWCGLSGFQTLLGSCMGRARHRAGPKEGRAGSEGGYATNHP